MHSLENTQAQKIINDYLSLPIKEGVPCPYFNNKRSKIRGGLRVMVGKGSPEEIVEEAHIKAIQNNIDFSTLSTDQIKKFLIDNGFGVDCSGFAYHVLSALSIEKTGHKLSHHICIEKKSLIGKIKAKLRPIENTGVAVLADEKNSTEVSLDQIEAGDFIVFIGTGTNGTYNHVMIITDILYSDSGKVEITYAHSYSWPSDGLYNHGVRFGNIGFEIKNTDTRNTLTSGIWTERNETGETNYTFQNALTAKEVSIRRLRAFMK